MVERPAVDVCDVRDVFGALEPALDFQGGDSDAHEVGQHLKSREILRAQQIAAVAEVDGAAVGDEFVGHAAGLGAFATVGGAAAERLAGEALTGVGDTERAVDEDFERQGRRRLRVEG
jgi:hypothetical protein